MLDLMNKFKAHQAETKYLTRYIQRNELDVVKPFVSALKLNVEYFGDHVFVLSESNDYTANLATELETLNFGEPEFVNHSLELDSWFIEYYNRDFNISLILIYKDIQDDFLLALALTKKVNQDIDSSSEKTLNVFLSEIRSRKRNNI